MSSKIGGFGAERPAYRLDSFTLELWVKVRN